MAGKAEREPALVTVAVRCPDAATAERIGEAVVLRRQAACAHVGPAVASTYRWRGAIETVGEVTLDMVTRAERFDELAATVRALHPYEVPAIVATPVVAASPAYASWVVDETGRD
ncbi:divalent-cation tolerance protein CutA [Amaricoccus sp.]|uniref:divalent-cation tolerance protein CutA n=1 Tax=Amaricoccus sp. TaxID=1872485 RepID=UPI001B584990|nr:divalent-cation tolerance protein CutA [Amaricoccus sp.]MBP7003079.1 divalent-cation tolerance protein CutA [Amaricoccus sp.]